MRAEAVVLEQESVKIVDGRDVDVVDNQNPAGLQPPVQREIFKLRKRIAMRTVYQSDIDGRCERLRKHNRALCGATDPFDLIVTTAWEVLRVVDARADL